MNYKILRNLLEWLVATMLIVGLVTAALNVTFGGFTPIMWFLIAFLAILIIICTEVTQIREFLESKKKS
jgi:hypothetical protein